MKITDKMVETAARAHTPQFDRMDSLIRDYALVQMRAALETALEAALAAVDQQPVWQTMDTAPDSGVIVGLMDDGGNTWWAADLFIGSHHGEKRYYNGAGLGSGSYIRQHPSAWMPFPKLDGAIIGNAISFDPYMSSAETLEEEIDAAIARAEKAEAERDAAMLRLKTYEEVDAKVNQEFVRISDSRAEKAEAALASVNDTLRKCWGANVNIDELDKAAVIADLESRVRHLEQSLLKIPDKIMQWAGINRMRGEEYTANDLAKVVHPDITKFVNAALAQPADDVEAAPANDGWIKHDGTYQPIDDGFLDIKMSDGTIFLRQHVNDWFWDDEHSELEITYYRPVNSGDNKT